MYLDIPSTMNYNIASCTVDFLIQTTRTTIHSVIAKKNRRTITQNVLQVLGAGHNCMPVRNRKGGRK